MGKVFMKGSEAIAESAVRSGCRFFAGYPITPQNEIPEYFARRMPEVGGTFIQGESEVASVNMVYGAGASGTRAMTSSASTGISLKSEGISFCASARVPMVYCNMSRGGPGIGSIQPSQQDYLQATKASGNGGFRMIVFAPATVQEAADMAYQAFDLAERDRNPVLILGDGVLATIMEPVELPPMRTDEEVKALKEKNRSWALVGHDPAEGRSFICPGYWSTAMQEQVCINNEKMYKSWDKDIQVETIGLEDAQVVVSAFGTSGRIARSAVEILRKEGLKVGMIRPKTISPFPYSTYENLDYSRVKGILEVEMAIPALMIEDVQLGVKDRCPIETYLRAGGEIVSRTEIIHRVRGMLERM